jgi:hypothetical protein
MRQILSAPSPSERIRFLRTMRAHAGDLPQSAGEYPPAAGLKKRPAPGES